jgi:hypothetical protein
MASRQAIIEWLLDADPSIRWQVMRDLTDAPEADIAAERARIAHEGWGGELLDLQSEDGHWNDAQNHGWMTTTDALHLLYELGADPTDARVRKALDRVREHVTWHQIDGRPFFDGETEACINGRILAAGAYFGADSERLMERLVGEQLADGGWNCEAPPSTRSSFHSTICVLEGLLEYERARGALPAVTEARRKGEEYLLARRMIRSLTAGDIISKDWTRFSFPVVWYYDVLRGLDYFRSAGAEPDERCGEAIDIVRQRAHQNGRWPLNLQRRDQNRVPIRLETDVGKASRWNTLRALRVLDWHGNGAR